MNKWIKENLVLLSGILLPALLVGGFFVLDQLPKTLADPPTYDFLMVGYQYDYQHPADYYLSFEVREGRLTGQAVPKSENSRHINRQTARLFRYQADDNRFEEILFDLPAGLATKEEPVALDLHDTDGLRLDKRSTSPDGYQFEFMGYRGRGGLLGEIFGMGRRYESNYVLKKDSVYIDLPEPTPEPYLYQNDLHFLGWIVDESLGQ